MAKKVKAQGKEDWLSKRAKGIGGSDIAAILGASIYKTPFEVWLDKTGQGQPFMGNKHTEAGHYLEESVANYYQDRSGNTVIKASAEDVLYVHDDYPFILGTPDRRYRTDNGQGVLECKTTQMKIEATPDELPRSWFCQLQWYMMVTGLRQGSIAWLERGVDFKYMDISYIPEFGAHMLSKAVEFWRLVESNTPPPASNPTDLELMFEGHEAGKWVQANDSMLELHGEIMRLQAAAKEIEEELKAKKDAVKMEIGDAEGMKHYDSTLFTWKQSKDSEKFDAKRFLQDHPELYHQYLVTQKGTRRFLPKAV